MDSRYKQINTYTTQKLDKKTIHNMCIVFLLGKIFTTNFRGGISL